MISSELNTKILEVVESSITVEQFEDWLVPRLPGILALPELVDADVVAAIELGLAEMSDGIIIKDEFYKLLREIIKQNETIYYSHSSESYASGSSNQTIQATIDFTATL